MLKHLEASDLDAIISQLKNTFSFGDWDKIILLSERLIKSVDFIRNISKITGTTFGQAERSLMYYYGFAYMATGTAYQKKGFYAEARECILKYGEWSWVVDPQPEDCTWMDYWTRISEINLVVIELLMGKPDALRQIVDYMFAHPEDALAGMITILEAANQNNLNVDTVLAEIPSDFWKNDSSDGVVNMSYQYKFFYQLSLYEVKRNSLHSSLGNILQAMKLADKMKNVEDFKACLEIYESLKDQATPQQEKEYQRILKGAIRHEEMVAVSIAGIRST